jgi:electron transport complex protein RnfG
MKNDFVMPVIILSLICLVVSGLLAFVNYETEPIILQAAAQRAYEARREIIPQADAFILLEDVEGLPRTVHRIYAAENGTGFVINVTSSGYGGDMEILCGIGPDGRIIKTTVLSHTETQGLGTIVFDRAIAYEGKDQNLEGIDAIAGSTITSNAYKRAVQDAFKAYEIVKGVRP